MHDALQALVNLLFGRRPHRPDSTPDEHDVRLGALEEDQREINARLSLLERQADPRGRGRWPEHG